MKSFATLAVVGALFAAPAFAGEASDHAAHHAAASSATLAQGEIRRVDKEAKKLTIRHGEIKNLDMPPMTMVFQVQDPALLNQVKVGDKVRFAADKKDGAYVVTKVEPDR